MNRRRSSSSKRPAHGTRRASPSRANGRLRLIGGDYRRRQLPVLERPGLRPTPDRIRETLFNWLAFELAGAHVLDLYAGTGALGLEALSRGAAQALFVETESDVAASLSTNIDTLGANGHVQRQPAMAFLAGPVTPFDIVFLDPPFRQGHAVDACQALEEHGWLSEEALIYLEIEHESVPQVPANWQLHREVSAGDGIGRLYRRHRAT
ncbi:16S rRNA (guanine(966)-N(2))-methyltransferase RsmD [Chromohalobacter sp. TMW 2.2308]|uniref:16S rRNA (guanine(966)-N(2))-methyltransferase RsmD n=1 Tax=Chromohalobacter TaxID=42054 RepID=UPI001FFCE9A5|nr:MULTISPECIES: 16S rRNA (guanine(966)-N(2))-methyltransferase RsmD [Chromohalobacter]MCK2042363.1 16S rRNA (guanine(966)-N(2))-methyltransferase RsmD [Chromohalobacter moromii]MCT8515118.1 16S rRNA (guanine(966)-N(2))-methyltransferase RsmD [Chromohalobacter sp. TMW 2.2271]